MAWQCYFIGDLRHGGYQWLVYFCLKSILREIFAVNQINQIDVAAQIGAIGKVTENLHFQQTSLLDFLGNKENRCAASKKLLTNEHQLYKQAEKTKYNNSHVTRRITVLGSYRDTCDYCTRVNWGRLRELECVYEASYRY